jgi:hypothetical protein
MRSRHIQFIPFLRVFPVTKRSWISSICAGARFLPTLSSPHKVILVSLPTETRCRLIFASFRGDTLSSNHHDPFEKRLVSQHLQVSWMTCIQQALSNLQIASLIFASKYVNAERPCKLHLKAEQLTLSLLRSVHVIHISLHSRIHMKVTLH